MKSFVLLVHYHELGLKGHNRPRFERQLIKNIAHTLHVLGLNLEIKRISGRVLVYLHDHEQGMRVLDSISKIPGVARVSLGEQVEKNLEAINCAALAALERSEPFESFKVEARRANTSFHLDSMELNRQVGAYLVAHTTAKKVKMKGQDATVHVEIIKDLAYVYSLSKPAIGGLPVGTAGKLVSLLSSGFDSPVATWQMMRRGAEIWGLHFSGAPETSDSSSYLVRKIAEQLRPYGGIQRVCCVPFGGYQRMIALEVPEKLRIIFYRRLMFATACALAQNIGAKGIITGESLGQVASQTLDNMLVVDAVATLPVYRPLVGTDKQEIIEQAQKLGTFALSSKSSDDCCTLFMPRSPETHAHLPKVEAIWQTLPHEKWVQEIVSTLSI